MSLPTVASLWIGGNLSFLEQLCLKSFVDHGHRTLLYTYEDVSNTPDGVEVLDANSVYPSKTFLTHKRTGSPANHADAFRYRMIAEQDVIWVDADMLCMRPWAFSSDFVFGWEKTGKTVCNAVLGLPAASKTLQAMNAFCQDEFPVPPWAQESEQNDLRRLKEAGNPMHVSDMKWGVWGPKALTYFLQQTGEIEHAFARSAFYPIAFRDRTWLLRPNFPIEDHLGEGCYGVHLWNRRLRRRLITHHDGLPKPRSFLGLMLLQHGIDPCKAMIPNVPPSGRTARDEIAKRIKAVDAGDPQERVCATQDPLPLVEIHGLRIPLKPDIITPKIEKALRLGKYEGGEIAGVQKHLQKNERILELGAGLGLVSAVCARRAEVDKVLTIEANPKMTEFIAEIHALNGIENVEVRHGAVARHEAGPMSFYLKSDFWGSALELNNERYIEKISVPCLALPDLVSEFAPTIIVCDIEGGEFGLFDGIDLDGVHTAIVELHPKKLGDEGVASVIADLERAGLLALAQDKASTVQVFRRSAALTDPPSLMRERDYRPWGVADPKVLIPTCMKNEGPFILEWIAWHQAIGVTDFVVFSNDCTDGTDAILDRLDAMGIITHLQNPAIEKGSTYLQPEALKYLHQLENFNQADFVISMDVDEFVNIHVGQGRFADLLNASDPFDALSMSELNHGSNGHQDFEPGWVTDLFPGHQTRRPGKWKAHRGVKTITRLSPKVRQLRNHRPDFLREAAAPVWLDGSGRQTGALIEDGVANGFDCRGCYDLVTLDHYPLRSLQSFLVKMHRGDVVIKNKSVNRRYWRVRNHHTERSTTPAIAAAARRRYDGLLKDFTLRALHKEACACHSEMIRTLSTEPVFMEMRDWILTEAWNP